MGILSAVLTQLITQMFPDCGPQGALLVLWGAQVVCLRDILLNKIRAENKVYILIGTLLG
jgi:hypothetical protein